MHFTTAGTTCPSQAIHVLGALAPQQLPPAHAVQAWLQDADVARIDAIRSTDAMAQLCAVVRSLPPRARDTVTVSQIEDAEHDRYFRIERVENTPVSFVALPHLARLLLLQDVHDAQPLDDVSLARRIDRALVDMISCQRGGRVGSDPCVLEWASAGTHRNPMARWVRGHQVFVALTQGLIAAFRAMAVAIREGDTPAMERWADLAVSLLDGSTATFEFTGDFSTDVYTEQVRPSMMPPATPFCLSGMMSIDHRHLVTVIRDMKPALKALHQQDATRHERIAVSLRNVYTSHIHTCERFVGNQPSIMTEGKTEKSGVSLLEHFRTIRLRPFAEAEAPQRVPSSGGGTTSVSPAAPPTSAALGTCPFPHAATSQHDTPRT